MRAGIRTVIIPAENEADLEEIDKVVRQTLNFITTDNIDGILEVALDFSGAGSSEFGALIPVLNDKAPGGDELDSEASILKNKNGRSGDRTSIKH